MEKKKNGQKKKRRWIKFVVIILILLVILLLFFRRSGNTTFGFTNEVAEKRDIHTTHSFSGSIAPVTEEVVQSPQTGLKVKELMVEEGDTVKAGDVLMVMDSTNLEEAVKEKEAAMASSEKISSVAIRQASNNLNTYQQNLAENLDAQMLASQQAVDASYTALINAEKAFNNEVTLNNKGLSASILSTTTAVQSSYNALKNTEATVANADKATADKALESPRLAYNQALQNYEAAKLNEENTLTTLYDNVVTAQNSYLNALDNYRAAMKTSDLQMKNYQFALESARAQADTTLSELQLADLKRQLGDCTVTAPIDGVVTALPVKVGDVAAVAGLATITQFKDMKIDIKINEYDILGAEEGKDVTIIVDALNKTYEGKIKKIAKVATVEAGVSYFKSEVEFLADEDTRSGMSVEVKLPIYDLENVLTISNKAIQTEKDGSAYVNVYGADGKSVEKKSIVCGVSDGMYTEIKEGLKEGDTVLVPMDFSQGMVVVE